MVLCITLFVSCSSDDDESKPKPSRKVDQTLFLFFPYADNLTTSSYFIPSDLREIKDYIQSEEGMDGYRVIVYFGKSSYNGVSTIGDLYEMKYENGTLLNDTIAHYDNVIQSDKDFLVKLFAKVKNTSDTPRYALITGGHGCGWLPSQLYYGYVSRSFGGASDKSLRIEVGTFSDALAEASLHPEYILFDDCLMNNIEVLYRLRKVTDYIIATPAEQPGEGMPYYDIMPYLTGNPQYERIAETFIQYYGDFSRYSSSYKDYATGHRENPGTICITKCSEIEGIANSMKQLNEVTTPSSISNPDVSGIQRMDQASEGIYYDLLSYAEVLASTAEGTEAQLKAVRDAIAKATVSAKHGGFYLAKGDHCFPITTYCGITVSDPTRNQFIIPYIQKTSWWYATH